MIPIVLNRTDLEYGNPYFVKFLGDKGRIGIYDLSDKDFIANGNNFGKHQRLKSFFNSETTWHTSFFNRGNNSSIFSLLASLFPNFSISRAVARVCSIPNRSTLGFILWANWYTLS